MRALRHLSWRELFSSALFRLFVIVLAVVIPLNLLTLVLGSRIIREVERQISLETQNALNLYIGQVDGALRRAANTMNSISRNDSDYTRLRDKPEEDQAEFYRQVQAVVNLSRTLKEKLEGDTMIDGAFAWFPEKDYFVQNSNAKPLSAEVRTMIQSSDGIGSAEYHGWRLFHTESGTVLLTISEYRGSCFGAWTDLRTLADALGAADTGDGSFLLFTDGTGTVWYSADADIGTLELSAPYQRYDGVDYALVRADSTQSELRLVQLLSKRELTEGLPFVIRLLQILSIVSVLIIPVIILAMQRWVISPVSRLSTAMERIENGELDYRIEESAAGTEFDRINRSFNNMMDEVRDLKISLYEEQLKAQKIKMGFLAQQIRPHFILNALNILYSYEPEDYALSQRMILCLSKYFRYVVNANMDFVPLGQELDHIRNYFEIQQARFRRTFRAGVASDDDAERCLVPPLLVQSFAENAIKHAFTPGEIIDISVSARREGERVFIRVSDTGAGITDEALARIEDFRKTREFRRDLGVGIQNSIDRLDILYADRAELNISRGEPHGTVVELVVPFLREELSEDERDIG